jgi:hypothetical protein
MRSSRTEMMMMSDSDNDVGISPSCRRRPRCARGVVSSTCRPCSPMTGTLAHEARRRGRADDARSDDEDRRVGSVDLGEGAGVHFGFGHVAGHAGSL